MFTKAIIEAPECTACGTPMRLIEAGISKKTGNPYSAFWSCPHNQTCGGKTLHYEEPKPNIPVIEKPTEIPPIKVSTPQISRQQITIDLLFDELRAVNEKLDIIIKEIVPEQ